MKTHMQKGETASITLCFQLILRFLQVPLRSIFQIRIPKAFHSNKAILQMKEFESLLWEGLQVTLVLGTLLEPSSINHILGS